MIYWISTYHALNAFKKWRPTYVKVIGKSVVS